MSLQYDDSKNQMPPMQPIPAPVTSTGGFMDFIKNNKLAVAIAIIILIALIWWFCIRKNGDSDKSTTITTMSPQATGTNIKITKRARPTMF